MTCRSRCCRCSASRSSASPCGAWRRWAARLQRSISTTAPARSAGLPLTWSEEPLLLGTLGALGPLAGFFAGADLALVVNGDSLCRWPLAELLARHLATGAPATLLLAARADPADFGGGVGVDSAGKLLWLLSA